MTLRDKRQQEFADEWLKFKFGILYLCPRFGKIFTTINILETYPKDIDILISYPDKEIKNPFDIDDLQQGKIGLHDYISLAESYTPKGYVSYSQDFIRMTSELKKQPTK